MSVSAPRIEGSMLEVALYYASLGWPVFPVWGSTEEGGCACRKGLDCPRPAKHPLGDLVPRGVKDATIDPDTIREWWTRRPKANIGLATGERSGLIVLDVDPDKGGFEALSALIRRHGPLPETFVVHTGGGGLHIYFSHPGVHVPNSSGMIGPGLDIRGD